jgi:hypothetical protein
VRVHDFGNGVKHQLRHQDINRSEVISNTRSEDTDTGEAPLKSVRSMLFGDNEDPTSGGNVLVEETQKWEAEKEAILCGAEAILAVAVEEKQKWEVEKEAISKVQQFEPIVELNIGSMRFETSRITLCRFPDTMIGCMFSGRHTLPRGKDGHFFIDRDGRHFHHILNFLRSPEGYKVGVTGAEEDELRRECAYYGIDELMFPLPPPPPPPTQKRIPYYHSSRSESFGQIGLRVDHAGVHTIADSGEAIKYCRNCHRGFFNIRADKYYFSGFSAQSPPAAQPRVQSPCSFCRH